MGLTAGQALATSAVDKVFIGPAPTAASRTCASRRRGGHGPQGRRNIRLALVVPGHGGLVKARPSARACRSFAAGFEWREPGCSMCLAMNADRLEPGERCASTSNRNFEGRQGAGGRTHLVSLADGGAAAAAGHFVDIRNRLRREPS